MNNRIFSVAVIAIAISLGACSQPVTPAPGKVDGGTAVTSPPATGTTPPPAQPVYITPEFNPVNPLPIAEYKSADQDGCWTDTICGGGVQALQIGKAGIGQVIVFGTIQRNRQNYDSIYRNGQKVTWRLDQSDDPLAKTWEQVDVKVFTNVSNSQLDFTVVSGMKKYVRITAKFLVPEKGRYDEAGQTVQIR
jgi:hypothetical protein